MHTCIQIYNHSSEKPKYGSVPGTCRITGHEGEGLPFEKWVKDTFTDRHNLRPGNIICNEAIFCFEEASTFLQKLTGKDKPQRFRNYSHFIVDSSWHVRDKGQKADMMGFMLSNPEVCVIAESGQRHLVFKHKPGMWQFEDAFIQPDAQHFQFLHSRIHHLGSVFSVDEIASGTYQQHRIIKYGLPEWSATEQAIKPYRGSAMFDLAIFFAKIPDEYGNKPTASS